MNKEEFLIILEKYRKGIATEDEEAFLLAYYELFDVADKITDKKDSEQVGLLKDHIKARIDMQAVFEAKHRSLRQRIVYGYGPSLAAAIVLLTATFYFVRHRKQTPGTQITRTTLSENHRILPGKNQAILTLGDGEMINLDEPKTGLMRQQDGVIVRKPAAGQLVYETETATRSVTHVVTTPRGGQYQLTLSDGTRVWLNAATSIRFPSVFVDTMRVVELNGEAYFEVAHDANRPFEVRSDRQRIRVLGTRFNVSSYADESAIRTTLIEGKVQVSLEPEEKAEDRTNRMILKPGQQSLLSGNGIKVSNVNPETAMAWKNGLFKFDKADIRSVMRQLSRWYDVEIEYRGKEGPDLFTGEIKRDEDIANVLRILELNNVNVRMAGRTIVITH